MSTVQDVTRREAIADYGLIVEPPPSDLQGIVELAAMVCDVPRAVINIHDDRFQHQIAAVGFTAAACEREDSMCAVVLRRPGLVVVPDARLDDRFAANPFVSGILDNVRFYASSPLITPAGVAIGTLCVFDNEVGDLTADHRLALDHLAHQVVEVLELRRTQRELQRSNEHLEHFARQVSHDLRNPLMALSGFLELAAESPEVSSTPRVAAAIFRAESAADRMSAMIAELLDYARIGGARLRYTDVDVEGIARAVVDDLDSQLAETSAIVLVDAPETVDGDATLLRILLQNLVSNAVKFSAASGVVPRIEIRVEPLPGGWRLTVDDNGPGVAPEQRDRVFALMERGDAEDVPGLGIGLSTCRRIVDAHEGRIGIDESPLGGAEVWVVLPAASVEVMPAA
jgi:signal transduction histidine kinase